MTGLTTSNHEQAPTPEQISTVQQHLLVWYATNGRDLPWRHTRDPYQILLSETMLQQTQVPRVLPRWQDWLAEFPTLAALAAAPTAAVLRAWSGLGYNSRAVRLQAVARQVVAEFGGELPHDVATLRSLPGIGDYTARAVACFAYEQDLPVLDTNVKRVLHRVFVGPELPHSQRTERQLWSLAEAAVPAGHGYDWNQALMDFGSLICTARKPACLVCPLRTECRAAPTINTLLAEQAGARRQATRAGHRAQPFTSTTRYFRGQTLRSLGQHHTLTLDALGPLVKPNYTSDDRPWLYALVSKLASDGLVSVRQAGDTSTVRETGGQYQTTPADTPADMQADLKTLVVSLPES